VVRFGRAERVGDKVEVGWDISEANPDWASFEMEFRSDKGDWHPVAFRASKPSQGVKFAVPPVGVTAVRVRLSDMAGNRGEETIAVGGPPAPIAPRKDEVARSAPFDMARPSNKEIVPARGDSESAAPVPLSEPRPSALPGVTGQPSGVVTSDSAKVVERQAESSAVIAESKPVDRASSLPPPRIINTPKFNVDYTITEKGSSACSKIEVFVTTDNGRRWALLSKTEKIDGPILVDLTGGRPVRRTGEIDGVYGLRFVPHSLAVPGDPPSAGDLPEMRVELDTVEPKIDGLEPIHNGRDALTIKWVAKDRNLVAEPVTLEWAESKSGPFFPIVSADAPAEGPESREGLTRPRPLANTGEYVWKIPANFPTHKVYLKYTARDAAGNISEAVSFDAFRIDMTKLKGTIEGITPVAPK
jgi:hypothetical protein